MLKSLFKKEKFRQNVIDVVMILPKKEGTIIDGGQIQMRVPLSEITNIDFMSATFRQMWITLCQKDNQLKKEFESYFKNQEIEKKRQEKLLQKMMIKANTKQSKKIGEKLEKLDKIIPTKYDSETNNKTAQSS